LEALTTLELDVSDKFITCDTSHTPLLRNVVLHLRSNAHTLCRLGPSSLEKLTICGMSQNRPSFAIESHAAASVLPRSLVLKHLALSSGVAPWFAVLDSEMSFWRCQHDMTVVSALAANRLVKRLRFIPCEFPQELLVRNFESLVLVPCPQPRFDCDNLADVRDYLQQGFGNTLRKFGVTTCYGEADLSPGLIMMLNPDTLVTLSLRVTLAEQWEAIACFSNLRYLSLDDCEDTAANGLRHLHGHRKLEHFRLYSRKKQHLSLDLLKFCQTLPGLTWIGISRECIGGVPGTEFPRSLLTCNPTLQHATVEDWEYGDIHMF
jgi:hypothetical protein